MKKLFSLIFLLFMVTLIYSGIQISKAFTSEIPVIDDNLQVVKRVHTENKKEEINNTLVDEVETVETKTDNRIQENIEKQENETKEETHKEIIQETQVQNYQQEIEKEEPIVQVQKQEEKNEITVEEKSQIDPNETDTHHILYILHKGVIDYYNFDDCNNAGYNIQRQNKKLNLAHSCYEVYNVSGNVKGYFLDITNEGKEANYLK